eukprot:8817391-Prorocentrum_lima.AAC.1
MCIRDREKDGEERISTAPEPCPGGRGKTVEQGKTIEICGWPVMGPGERLGRPGARLGCKQLH